MIPPPTLKQMLEAYVRVKDVGLTNVRLGNIGIFVRTEEDLELLRKGTTMIEEGRKGAINNSL